MLTSFPNLLPFYKKAREVLARLQQSRGFTLIELLVVSLIIIIITMFVLFRQQGFNSSTLLRSLAYSVALSVRQAQVYGVSVRESGIGTGVFAPGFGVYFTAGDLVHYQLFADANGDGMYTTGEGLPIFTIGNGRGTDYKITQFCARTNLGDTCSPALNNLTIYFRRPNPDACFATDQNPSACAPGASPVYTYAYVQLQAVSGTDVRTVKVSSTGQIAVCKLNVLDVSTC